MNNEDLALARMYCDLLIELGYLRVVRIEPTGEVTYEATELGLTTPDAVKDREMDELIAARAQHQ